MRRPGVIRPIDYYSTEANNPITDYACLKHFFQCKETGAAGATINWTDSKGGLVFPIATTNASDGTKVDPAANTDIAATSGAWTAPLDKSYIVCLVQQSSGVSGGFTLGHGTDGRLANIAATAAPTAEDAATNQASANTTSLGTSLGLVGFAFTPNSATGIRTIQIGATDAWSIHSGNTTATIASMPAPSAILSSTVGAQNVYGLAVFVFQNGLPPDNSIREAMMYHKTRWTAGNKVIYPGWRHLL